MASAAEQEERPQGMSQTNNILFFDTETTGTPKSYNALMTDVDNWPRVIQLAWAVYTQGGEKVTEHCYLISPDGWEVPKEKFWIENGHSTERCANEGIPLEKVLLYFRESVQICDTMVAHNMQFDYNVLGAEMIRTGMRMGKKLERVCTMETGKFITKIPGPRGYKWPKLEELHRALYNGQAFDGAHDAGADVKACVRCYFRMLEIVNGVN